MSSLSHCSPEARFDPLGQITDIVSSYTSSLLRKIEAPIRTRTPSAMEQGRFEWPVSALLNAFFEATTDAEINAEQVAPSRIALSEAIGLLKILPPGLESPEPIIEPSGTIAWLWDRGADGFLVLAVNGSGRLQRSAIINGKETADKFLLSNRLSPEITKLLAHFRLTHG